MSLYQWEREYEQLLDKHLVRGEADPDQEKEKRGYPRLQINREAIWVNVDARCQVLDCSVSGISFYSSYLFKPGRKIRLVLGKTFAINATVLASPMVETDPNFLEVQYRVQCEFADDLQGKQMLVTIKELDSSISLETFLS